MLILASIGLVIYTLTARQPGAPTAVAQLPSPTTEAIAAVTPSRVVTPTPTATPKATATPRATRRTTAAARGTATTAREPLGSGRARGVRGIGGSIASVSERPAVTPTTVARAPAPTPTPTRVPVNQPPVANPPPSAPDPTPAPTATPTPTATAALPAVVLPDADARPYRYALTYSRNDDLGGIPPSEYAYTVTWRSYSAADVAALKTALGLRGPVEQTADGFRVTDPGTLIVSNAADGLIRYTAPADGPTAPTPTPSGTAARGAATPSRAAPTPLTDDAALAAAKTWLEQQGLPLPANANAGRVTRPVAGQVTVTFNPQQPNGPILGDPAIVVTMEAATGAVRELSYRWPGGMAAPALVRLRPVADAWADVLAGKGYAEVDATIPANTPPGTVFKGTARATRVRAGWTLGTAADGASYLLPVYVFEGEATLEGQPGPVPFRVFVPALP